MPPPFQATQSPPSQPPQNTNGAYMVCMEDQSCSGEFMDVCVLVDPRPDAIYCTWDWTKGHAWTQYVMYNPQNQVVNDVTGKPCNYYTQGQVFTVPYGQCSYGISNRAPALFNNDSDHVLFVEYFKLVADVLPIPPPGAPAATSDATVLPAWSNSVQWGGWGASRFRHTGTMNVLFYDGHVEGRNPAAINPFVESIGNNVWKPSRDPAF
jgi:prepilin-type processing-associated H-X9-DG protein